MDKFLLKCSHIKHKKSSTESNFGKINFDDEEIVYLVKPQSYRPHSFTDCSVKQVPKLNRYLVGIIKNFYELGKAFSSLAQH